MDKQSFIELKKGSLIYSNQFNTIFITKSSFINTEDVETGSFIVQDYFTYSDDTLDISNHDSWEIYNSSSLLNQELMNKLFAKKINTLERNVDNILNILKNNQNKLL